MRRKFFYLTAALAFPIAIFLFLKFFGKNEFAVEPLYQQNIPPTACPFTYELPYAVPDSVLAIVADGASLTLVAFPEGGETDETEKLFRRLSSLFAEDPVRFHNMVESTAGNDYDVLRKCVFFLSGDTTAALIDHEGRIRGKYATASAEDADRLIVELKIILRKF